jgi:uncharacterized protein YbaR (Trm112 family)
MVDGVVIVVTDSGVYESSEKSSKNTTRLQVLTADLYSWVRDHADARKEMGADMTTISPRLMEVLVCPLARTPLVQVGDWLYSTDAATRRRYPIRDGIPVMLIDESETVAISDFERVMTESGRTPVRSPDQT